MRTWCNFASASREAKSTLVAEREKKHMKLTLANTKTGKVTYAVVRVMAHDPKPMVGGKGAKYGWPNTVITAIEER